MVSQVAASQKLKYAKYGRKIKPYLFISPFFILYALFGIFPLCYGMYMALTSKQGFGFGNFTAVIYDDLFWKSITNAALYSLGSVFIILPVALYAALMLSSQRLGKLRGFVSTVYFFPNVTSVIAIGIVFKLLLKTNNGTINTLLETLGLIQQPLKFLSDPNLAIPSLLILATWRYFGINSLYFLSGLQGIPQDLCEAARIDGCSAIKELLFIKIPLLRPIATFVVFTAIVGSFSLSGEIYTLVGEGGTGARNSMLFPVVYLYNMMFRDSKMNQAAAMGYVLAVILIIITSIQRYVFTEHDKPEVARR